MFELNDRVAMITGAGSSRGIGQAIARALSRQGAAVAVCDINSEGATAVADALQRQGASAKAYELDVTNEASVESAVSQIVRELGGLDILVNNAGITQPVTVDDTTLDCWNRIYSVNATGAFLCSRAAVKHMKERRYGRIINMSSVSAKRGGGVFGGAHYSAAKAAVLGFSKALARETAQYGITVNSLAPGLILTDIWGGFDSPERAEELAAQIPAQRLGTPEEVAAAVCFLSSVEAGYITGEEIDINGGSHMD